MGAAEKVWAHPFERSGFGHAPYKCVGYYLSKFQACQGAPIQCGTSCDACATGIMHVYEIQSADGVRFKVGCDCAQKTGDTSLTKSMRSARWEFVNREYLAQKRIDREARERTKAELADRMAVEYATGLEALFRIYATTNSDRVQALVWRIATHLLEGNVLDLSVAEREKGSWRDDEHRFWIALGESTMPESKHVGTVGQRMRNVTATLVRSVSFDTMYGTKWIETFRTDAGETLVWKTTSPGGTRLGMRFTFDATVKAHSQYNGEVQTEVSRVKVKAGLYRPWIR